MGTQKIKSEKIKKIEISGKALRFRFSAIQTKLACQILIKSANRN
jgi:hypothetical protein